MTIDELQARLAHLEAEHKLAAALLRVSREMNAASSEAALLAALARLGVTAGASQAALWYLEAGDDGPEWAEAAAVWQRDGSPAYPVGTRHYLPEFPLAYLWLANREQPNFLADAASDDRLGKQVRDYLARQGTGALVSVPLVAPADSGGWTGLLTIGWPEAHRFSAQETAFYQALPALAAPVVAKQRQLSRSVAADGRMRLLEILEATSDVVATIDTHNHLTYVNQAGREQLGIGPDEDVTPLTIMEFSPVWVAEMMQQEAQPAAMRDGLWRGEAAMTSREGREFPVSQVVMPHYDADGRPVGMSTIARDISEQKAIEHILRESQERLRVIIENVPIVFFSVNTDGVFTLSEGRGLANLGLEPGQVVGLNVEDVYKDVPALLDEVARALDGEQFTSVVEVGPLVFQTSYTPLFDEQGSVTGTIGVSVDVTAQQRAQAELQASEARMRQLFDNAEDALYLINGEGRFVDVSARTAEVVGYSRDELLNMAMWELETDWTPERYAETHAKMPVGMSRTATGTHRRKDGTLFPIEARITAVEVDGEKLLAAFIRDVSERMEAEAALKRERDLMNTILDNLPIDVYLKDTAGRLVYASRPTMNTLRVETAEEYMGKTDFDFMPREMAEEYWMVEKAILEGGDPLVNAEVSGVDPDGVMRWALASKLPMFDDAGQTSGLLGIGMDITDLKQAEADREHLQQQVIEAQQQTLKELSTPIIPVMDGIIVMPLIGGIDTLRARDIMRALLDGITRYKAEVLILDITGVPVVDSGVAAHLNKTIMAAKLKGARAIVTGISESVAETVVDLGIDWDDLETLGDLRSGLIEALRGMGIRLVRTGRRGQLQDNNQVNQGGHTHD